ncbi:MAG TPA: hypothetical protein VL122_10495 [Nitrospirota bacterium]|nr:hypothetical protein [Nitrospirota bacterium]
MRIGGRSMGKPGMAIPFVILLSPTTLDGAGGAISTRDRRVDLLAICVEPRSRPSPISANAANRLSAAAIQRAAFLQDVETRIGRMITRNRTAKNEKPK